MDGSRIDEGFSSPHHANGEGARVDKFLGVVTGEATRRHIFRDCSRDSRVSAAAPEATSGAVRARDAALEDRKAAARELGADGIVGIDLIRSARREQGMMMVAVSARREDA